MTFTLTDDEILAGSAVLERDWPLPLRTVGPTPDDIDEAVVRGLRALLARELLSSTAGNIAVDADLGQLLNSADLQQLMVTFFVTGGDVEPEAASPVTYVFPLVGTGDVLRLTAMPSGLNTCERTALTTVSDQVSSLVRTRWGSSVNAQMRMSFVRRDEHGLQSIEVGAGGAVMRLLVTGADGVVRDVTEPRPVDSMDDAVSTVRAWTS